MKWSPQQDRALKAVDDWLSNGDQVFRLFGYAGTGKTTLARHLASGAGNVRFAAYTGKAAHVLHQNGCHGASTLHSLVYTPRDKSTAKLRAFQVELAGQSDSDMRDKLERKIRDEVKRLKNPSFTLNEDSPLRRTDLLVVDECSMVDARVGNDLLSFGCKVLVLGDPAQLPPVRGGGYFTDCQPDIMLTEIHRQAAGNPIIDLATRVREGQNLTLGTYGESRVVSRIHTHYALDADQIIVGRNKTRHQTNKRMRELLGYGGIAPNVGERLVCLRNNHELGLMNGSIWEVEKVYSPHDDLISMSISPEYDCQCQEVLVHRAPFEGQEVDWHTRREAEEFCSGYALTCHKAQGSQWDHVLVIDESDSFRSSKRRWLYTAITRAADSVVIKL